jgi:hypothetical protein
LEKQIFGSYVELGNDLLLLASVGSINEEEKLNAMRAMQHQEFNQDDIQGFKYPKVAGAGNYGLVEFFETKWTKTDTGFKEFFSAIITDANENRIVATKENYTDRGLSKVQKISTNLNHDNAKPDEKIEQEDGNWSTC